MGNAGNARALLRLIAFTASFYAGQAGAASQGALGSPSSGSVSITVSVPTQARVSGLEDIEFAAPGTDGVLTGSHDICLSSNLLARSFTVTTIGSGPEGSLELSNGSQSVAYSVRWSAPESGNAASPRWVALPAASLDTSPGGLECQSGRGLARLTIAIDNPRRGTEGPEVPYSGILTVILSPH